MKQYLQISFLLLFIIRISAQEIVNVEYHSSLNRLVLLGIAATFGASDATEFNYDVDLYQVTYTTTGSDMNPDTASGLLLMPNGIEGQVPMAVYQHGTTGRDNVPSDPGGEYLGVALIATFGVVTMMPDFLGLGTSRGFHPFVNARTEATAAVDMIRAVEDYLSEQSIAPNGQLLISGYSQGGHAAMALHKYIEEEIPDEYVVTASAPMSGPYSISGVMRELAFGEEEYLYPSFIVYTARGAREIDPTLYQDESQLFKEEFLGPIEQFVSTGENVGAFNLDLIDIHLARYLELVPRNMFLDSILEALTTQEDHPFNLALQENDLYDWTPQAPVLMLYCPGDDQVPFENSIIADSVMNANGAFSVEARDVSGGNDRLDHTQCARPAIRVALEWLLSFIQTTPIIEIGISSSVEIYPNPSSDRFIIKSADQIDQLLIASIAGATFYQNSNLGTRAEIEISNWPDGMYTVQIISDHTLVAKTLVVQH